MFNHLKDYQLSYAEVMEDLLKPALLAFLNMNLKVYKLTLREKKAH